MGQWSGLENLCSMKKKAKIQTALHLNPNFDSDHPKGFEQPFHSDSSAYTSPGTMGKNSFLVKQNICKVTSIPSV